MRRAGGALWSERRPRVTLDGMRLGVIAVVATWMVTSMACDPGEAPTPVDPPGSVGVVLVVDGAAWPYGNEDVAMLRDCEQDLGGPCRIVTLRVGIRAPLAHVLTDQLARAGAVGSRGALVFIERAPRVVFDGELAAMTGARLPPQRDQEGVTGGDLGPALRLALDQLATMPTRRKVLLVVARQYLPLPDDLPVIGALLTAAQVDVAAVAIDDGIVPIVTPPGWGPWRRAIPTLGGLQVLDATPDDVPRVMGHWAAALQAGAPLTPPPPRPRPRRR